MRFLNAAFQRFKRVMKDESGFLQFLAPFIPAAKAALPFIGSALASKFSGSKSGGSGSNGGSAVDVQSLMPAWQESLGGSLGGWVQKFLDLYKPGESFGGQLSVKDPTAIEKMGLGELGTLLGKPATGDAFAAGKAQIMDTLAGKYADPSTSPFIQSFSKLAGQNLQDSINTARGQRGARGTYFTKAGLQEESRLGERTQNVLNTLIGEFMNTERGRQLSAATTAKSFDEYETDASLKRVGASQTFGALERTLEQASLERNYNAWLNQRSELKAIPGVGQSLFGTQVPTVTSTTSPGAGAESSIAPWITLAMQFLGGNKGGGETATSGGGFTDILSKLLPALMGA